MKVIGIILLIAVALLAGFFWYRNYEQVQSRLEAWERVDQALARLQAGADHEPKLLLRRTIADTVAELDLYSKRTSDKAKESRVQAANRAIRHLEFALEDLSIWGRTNWPIDTWKVIGIEYLQPGSLEVACVGSVPTVGGQAVARAHLLETREWLDFAREKRPSKEDRRIDFDKERDRCREEYAALSEAARKKAAAEEEAAEKRAATERANHLNRWSIHIDLRTLARIDLRVEADGEEVIYKTFDEGESKHIDAQSSVLFFGNRGPNAIEIKVNGAIWSGTWTSQSSYGKIPSAKISAVEAPPLTKVGSAKR